MQGLVQYIMDTYTIYCASAIAATVLLRSILACIFPLISPPMFKKLGDQWAISLFAFLASACMPLPILFFVSILHSSREFALLLFGPQKYGSWVRSKSKYARNDGMPIVGAGVPPSPPIGGVREQRSHPRASDMAGNML